MKRVYISHHDYLGGRYLIMEDEDAQEAVEGGFALNTEDDLDLTQEHIDKHLERVDEGVMQRSRDFFNRLNNPGWSEPEPEEVPPEIEHHRGRKGRNRRSEPEEDRFQIGE